jgi:hypothetical protein
MRTKAHARAARWRWGTIIPALVLLIAAGWLAAQLALVQSGLEETRAENHPAAEKSFALAGTIGVVERWIPAFNHGTANYRMRQWDAAATQFERAAALAPATEQCQIRLNWAWSLEASADELIANDDVMGSVTRLQQAQLILATASCPSEVSTSESPDAPEGTLEEQWNQTRERIESKTSDDKPPEETDDSSNDDQDPDGELTAREQQAQEQQQQAIDDGSRSEGNEGEKTW